MADEENDQSNLKMIIELRRRPTSDLTPTLQILSHMMQIGEILEGFEESPEKKRAQFTFALLDRNVAEIYRTSDIGDPASPEKPVYKKIKANPSGNFWMITCDEGWRTLIVCADLYENVADWLLDILGRTPYAKRDDHG